MLLQELTHRPLWDFELSAIYLAEGFVVSGKRGVRYYQARSLTNRAADLTALLDSMGQGIQTIEAANVGIEKATSLLEQMTSIANQAGTIAKIPSKEDIAQQLGENGAVVTTAQELYDAINSGKETICVYGHIDLGNIDDNGKSISLKQGKNWLVPSILLLVPPQAPNSPQSPHQPPPPNI